MDTEGHPASVFPQGYPYLIPVPLGERVFFFFLRVMFYAAEIFRSSS